MTEEPTAVRWCVVALGVLATVALGLEVAAEWKDRQRRRRLAAMNGNGHAPAASLRSRRFHARPLPGYGPRRP